MAASNSVADLKKQLETSHDIKSEKLRNGQLQIELVYFSSLSDSSLLKKSITDPFLLCETNEDFHNVLRSTLSCSVLKTSDELLSKLLGGFAGVFFLDEVYALYANKPLSDQPLEPKVETTIQGPQTALSENIDTNIKIIRQRYPSPTLLAEERTVGQLSKTKLSMLYDNKVVNRAVLEEVKSRLEQVDADIVQALGQLEALFTGNKYRLFPVTILTERPDHIVLCLAQGKVILMLQGTPFALIAPAVFYDFMSSMDDVYQTFWVSRAMVFLRYIALFLTISLPAIYVAIVSYNPEIFRVQFTLSIAGSRAAVPYPSYIEVFIMLFMIEALIEASIRLPRYIGSTATTVGGLILGQAAQQAGIVSSIMIIITSAVAISNFVIPINAMSFAFRVVKYPLIIMATLFGMFGLVSGLFCFMMYLANLQSFGEPYIRMYIGEKTVTGYKEGDLY
jgi:spore germination protein KA